MDANFKWIANFIWGIADDVLRDMLRRRIDGNKFIGILESDVHTAAITGWPYAMWQFADRNGRDLREIVSAKDLHFVEATDGDVGQSTKGVVREIQAIRDGPGLDGLQHRKWTSRVEHRDFAHVFQREPHLLPSGAIRGQNALS